MTWRQNRDDTGRHRSSEVQAEILEQRVRDGGGYEVKVKLPGGYVLDKIPVAAGNVYVGGGKGHTAHLTIRNGDDNQYEAIKLSSDPEKEFTPEKPTGFVQDPSNKKQHVSVDDAGIHNNTDDKPVLFHNDKFELSSDGKLRAAGGSAYIDLASSTIHGFTIV